MTDFRDEMTCQFKDCTGLATSEIQVELNEQMAPFVIVAESACRHVVHICDEHRRTLAAYITAPPLSFGSRDDKERDD